MKIHNTNPVSATRPVQPIQVPAKRSDPREVAAPAAPDAKTKPVEVPANEGHARLDAFAKKIEARFENALSSQDLSPRQQMALEKERDRFHSMFARFEAAYMDGAESAKMNKLEGMQKLLASFSKSVNHIVSGGDVGTRTDVQSAQPTTAAHPTAGRGPDAVDLVG